MIEMSEELREDVTYALWTYQQDEMPDEIRSEAYKLGKMLKAGQMGKEELYLLKREEHPIDHAVRDFYRGVEKQLTPRESTWLKEARTATNQAEYIAAHSLLWDSLDQSGAENLTNIFVDEYTAGHEHVDPLTEEGAMARIMQRLFWVPRARIPQVVKQSYNACHSSPGKNWRKRWRREK